MAGEDAGSLLRAKKAQAGAQEVELTTVASVAPPEDTGPGDAPQDQLARQDDEGASSRSDREVRGSSAWLQFKLMMWKHKLTKLRDKSQLATSFVAPAVVFVIMWLFRNKVSAPRSSSSHDRRT